MDNYTVRFMRTFEESITVKAPTLKEATDKFYADMEHEEGTITLSRIFKEEN